METRHERACLKDQRGFTLIELMIVILIIGIMIAIALPTYLGARQRAADRAMQTDMRTGLAAALAFYSENGDWTGFTPVQAASEEPRLPWVGAGAPARGEVSIQVAVGQELLLVGLSSSHRYFCLAQVAGSPQTTKGEGATFASVDEMTECTNGW